MQKYNAKIKMRGKREGLNADGLGTRLADLAEK
jgi:hypothetical protein